MNRILGARLFMAPLLVAILGLSLTTSTALAHHNGDYLAQDAAKQQNGPSCTNNCLAGYENYVYTFWTTANLPATWSVFFPMDVNSNTTAVVNTWQAAVPNLVFSKDTSGNGDLKFKRGVCALGAPALGCHIVQWFTYAVDADANYILRSDIYIDQSVYNQLSDTQKRQVIAHELGHFYGLHEQYVDSGPISCNSNVISVMDTFSGFNHCDNLAGPSATDVSRVNAYWGQGTMTWLQPQVVGPNIQWTWVNAAWAPSHHQFNAFYWDSGLGQWVQYVQWLQHTQGIGLHNITSQQVENPSRKMLETFSSQPTGHWHVACGHPWFAAYGVYGTWTCSSQVWVP